MLHSFFSDGPCRTYSILVHQSWTVHSDAKVCSGLVGFVVVVEATSAGLAEGRHDCKIQRFAVRAMSSGSVLPLRAAVRSRYIPLCMSASCSRGGTCGVICTRPGTHCQRSLGNRISITPSSARPNIPCPESSLSYSQWRDVRLGEGSCANTCFALPSQL
jgi:hypothetical protein